MSNRANAQRYSRMVGGGGSQDLDLFGIQRRRRIDEAQQYSNMSINEEKELSKLKAEAAKLQAALDYFKTQNIVPIGPDGNLNPILSRISTETSPIQADTIRTGAEGERAKATSTRDWYQSKEGDRAVKAGLEGIHVKPAAETSKLMERRVGPGEGAQFYQAGSLFDKPATATGSVPQQAVFNMQTGQNEMRPSMTTPQFKPSPEEMRRQYEESLQAKPTTPMNPQNMTMGSRAMLDEASMEGISTKPPGFPGLIPGGLNILKQGMQQNTLPSMFQKYRENVSDPLWRLLMGY